MSPQQSIVEHPVEMHSQAVSARQLEAAEGNGLGDSSEGAVGDPDPQRPPATVGVAEAQAGGLVWGYGSTQRKCFQVFAFSGK